MLLAKYKKLIVLLLVLVFTGQVLASIKMCCQTSSPQPFEQTITTQVPNLDKSVLADMPHAMMDHSRHLSMDAFSVDSSVDSLNVNTLLSAAALDCCADCDLSGCHVAVVLPSAPSVFTIGAAALLSPDHKMDARLSITAFFRPPILR